MLAEENCVFFLIGHCSNKHQCKDSHKVKNCPYKGCNPQMCHLRHPPVCKMWSFNVCPYETTCNHLHFFPQSSNTQVVETETILFNLTSLNDKEENVDRTKDLVQNLTKEKEENEKELKINLCEANEKIKVLEQHSIDTKEIYEANIKVAEEKILQLEKEEERLSTELAIQEDDLFDQQDTNEKLTKKLKSLKKKRMETDETLTEAKETIENLQKELTNMKETLINKDKEIIESVESFKTERVFQATKENVQEKEEKINCLEGENHKMSMRVDELETEAKRVLMELKSFVQELNKLENGVGDLFVKQGPQNSLALENFMIEVKYLESRLGSKIL